MKLALLALFAATACGPAPSAQPRPAPAPAPREVVIDIGPTGADLDRLVAQRTEALAHFGGTADAPDEARGARLLADACRGGEPESCRMIIYYAAEIGPDMYAEAGAACLRDDARACHRMGLFAFARNAIRRAVGHFARACELGYQPGCVEVAVLAEDGDPAKSLGTAEDLLTTACGHGVADACIELSARADDPARKQALRSRACELGDADACKPPPPPEPAEDIQGGVEGGIEGGVVGGIIGGGTIGGPPPPPPPPPPGLGSMLENNFVSGKTLIRPPERVIDDMERKGTKRLATAVRVCVDHTGQVVSADVERTDGYKAWDSRIVTAVGQWRYKPVIVDGKPTGVCANVTFRFVLEP